MGKGFGPYSLLNSVRVIMTESIVIEKERSVAAIERHIQTILIAVITGALFFSANYIFTDTRSKGVQQTQLEVLTSQVIEMRGDLRSLQNNYVRRDELKEIEIRVRTIESLRADERRSK